MIFQSHYKIIKKSGLFDERYYLTIYEDVRKGDIDPIEHYLKYGWKERRNPSEKFDTNFYLETYPDVKHSKINPLLHFVRYGQKEGRKAHPKSSIVIEHKTSRMKKILTLLKHAKDNPQLIQRAIDEVKLYGLRRTMLKVKNKYSKIEESLLSKNKIEHFDELSNLFNKKIIIQNFKTDKPIDIIIPVYNGFQFLEPLFNSIIKNTTLPYKMIFCVHN